MTSSRYVGLKLVVTFACELILLFSFVFCLVWAAWKFEFRIFLKLISNNWRQVDHHKCGDGGFVTTWPIYFLLACICGGGGSAVPMLLTLNLFSSVEDSTRFSAPNLASRGESRIFDGGFLQRFMNNRHIRVRNGGGMMTDNKIARYWGKNPSRLSRCPQQFSNWPP